jgi:hypothetical protein
MISFAPRATRATSMSLKLITFAVPTTIDLADRRSLALLFILVNIYFLIMEEATFGEGYLGGIDKLLYTPL